MRARHDGGRRWAMAAGLSIAAWALTAAGCATAPVRDDVCLDALRARGVAFSEGPDLKGVRTPVTVEGDRFPVRLEPRGRRPPQMDCQLAVALADAAPVFHRLGISTLVYSGAYDYRNRRRSNQLSAHAYGLAIDVHAFRGGGADYDVQRTFERDRRRWRGLAIEPGAFAKCVGRPRTTGGRTLRRLACRLKLHDAFRVIITPDDDADHRDHFHLEARPDAVDRLEGPAREERPVS